MNLKLKGILRAVGERGNHERSTRPEKDSFVVGLTRDSSGSILVEEVDPTEAVVGIGDGAGGVESGGNGDVVDGADVADGIGDGGSVGQAESRGASRGPVDLAVALLRTDAGLVVLVGEVGAALEVVGGHGAGGASVPLETSLWGCCAKGDV